MRPKRRALLRRTQCHNNTTPILAGLGLYLMYLAFFALFYRRTYLGGAKKNTRPA